MPVTQSDLESVWREAWLDAPDGAATFYEALTSKWRTARGLNAGGSLSSLSRNQSSHGYATPGPNTRTTVDAERISLAALKLYEALETELDVDRDDAGELEIYNEGIARFAAEDYGGEFKTDFSLLRACL